MLLEKLISERRRILNYIVTGALIAILFVLIEYFAKLNSDDPQEFIPLLIRGVFTGILLFVSVGLYEIFLKNRFIQKRFLFLVFVKSISYTFIISFWLITINSIWFSINGGYPFREEIIGYLSDEMYLINLASSFLVLVIVVSLGQINSLHRKGELVNFVLGKYHQPREVDRIFCFIDLKGSTTIAEKLGHYEFANFLKDFYSDISDAVHNNNAQIYQYVGDEVVLSWSFRKGIDHINIVKCFFEMKEIINHKKQKYMDKYGIVPEFKAGLHGGKVIVTWIGEIKKEIVYIGDVLNTAARIQGECNRLSKNFLISENLLQRIPDLGNINASFVEEITPRGREENVKLYSLEMAA